MPVPHTDWNGEAVTTRTLLDGLTPFCLTAKAVTADTRVGETVTTMVTQQPIRLRPRSLTAGDEVLLSAMVRNASEMARGGQVTLAVTHLQLTTPATQTVHLELGEPQLVGWPALAPLGGQGPARQPAATGLGWLANQDQKTQAKPRQR